MTDKIVKQIVLHAALERVWHAITDASEFGIWFGVKVAGEFIAGQTTIATFSQTAPKNDTAHVPHRDTLIHFVVEAITPMHHFSYRWHPFAIDPACDYDDEPMTLVRFDLSEVENGVLLTITETGFDRLPKPRRTPSLNANTNGWTHQAGQIELYLSRQGAGDQA